MSLGNKLEHTLRLSAPVLWALIILWLSLTSSPPQFPGILGWDKLLHAGAYGFFSLLLAQALLCRPFALTRPWWLAGLSAVTCGALLEILQFLTDTGRTAEWLDLLADALGVLICCVIFRHVMRQYCCHDE
jgi:VanZ family protein